MRTRQKQRVVTDTWRSLVCRTTLLEHWYKSKPTIELRWAKEYRQKSSSPNQLKEIAYVGAIIESDALPTGGQLKRESKLLTVIGLHTYHADCLIIFMLYPILLLHMIIFLN